MKLKLSSSVQSISRVWLFATPWIAAHQASLSITNSCSPFKLMSVESVMPSGHLILCRPILNTEDVCHSLLQWTTFCQTSPPWPTCLRWPHMAWLSFIELDKPVVHVIWLTGFLWLWFLCLPSNASRNTYNLTWVSLTLGMGYLFTAAPAKHSCCSLPWTRP